MPLPEAGLPRCHPCATSWCLHVSWRARLAGGDHCARLARSMLPDVGLFGSTSNLSSEIATTSKSAPIGSAASDRPLLGKAGVAGQNRRRRTCGA